jgi:hypothetical protein
MIAGTEGEVRVAQHAHQQPRNGLAPERSGHKCCSATELRHSELKWIGLNKSSIST